MQLVEIRKVTEDDLGKPAWFPQLIELENIVDLMKNMRNFPEKYTTDSEYTIIKHRPIFRIIQTTVTKVTKVTKVKEITND